MTDDQYKSLTDPQFKVYAEFIFKEGLTRAGVDYQEVVREADRRRRIPKPSRSPMYNAWTKKELNMLMGTETIAELSKVINRTPKAIESRRTKLRKEFQSHD